MRFARLSVGFDGAVVVSNGRRSTLAFLTRSTRSLPLAFELRVLLCTGFSTTLFCAGAASLLELVNGRDLDLAPSASLLSRPDVNPFDNVRRALLALDNARRGGGSSGGCDEMEEAGEYGDNVRP